MDEVSESHLQSAKRRFSSKTKWVLLLFGFVIVIVLCVLLCIVCPKLLLRGKFVSVNEGNLEYIQFNENRFRHESKYSSRFGSYSVNRNRIVLSYDDGTIEYYIRKKDFILRDWCFTLRSMHESSMRIYDRSNRSDYDDGSYYYTDEVLRLDKAGSYSHDKKILSSLFSNKVEITGSYAIDSNWITLIEDTTGEITQLYIFDNQLYDEIFRKQK